MIIFLSREKGTTEHVGHIARTETIRVNGFIGPGDKNRNRKIDLRSELQWVIVLWMLLRIIMVVVNVHKH